jgi:TRAP-type mannitol/chloroaromatic compound transport system substrate-binding protein
MEMAGRMCAPGGTQKGVFAVMQFVSKFFNFIKEVVMKKKVVLVAVLSAVVLVTMSFTCLAQQKVFNWKCQQHRIPAEQATVYYKDMFEKTLPDMTNGRLNIKMFWAGDLVKSTEALDAVKTGIVDMVVMPTIYFRGVIPEAAIDYGLPFGIRTPNEMYNFMYGKNLPKMFGGWRAIDLMRKIYAKHGVYYLVGGVDCWPASLIFNKPINKLSDLKGKKVRAAGLMMEWLQKFGAQAVFVPGEDAYTSLQTGTINGSAWGGAIAMYSLKFHEVAKYYLQPDLQPVNHVSVLINMKSWNALPKDLQVALEMGMIKAGLDFTNHYNWTGDQWAIKKMSQKGLKVCELKGAELVKAQQAAYEIWDSEAKKSPEAAELVKMVKSYMKEMGYMK